MDVKQAAELTGMKTSEISGLGESPAGELVYVADGTVLIVVPDDQPDAEGKTGLMFLVAPHDPYTGTMPVFAQPIDDEPVLPGAPDEDDDGLGDLKVGQLREIAHERGVDLGKARKRDDILAKLRAEAAE